MNTDLCQLLNRNPDAIAHIKGDKNHSDIRGIVSLYSVLNGVLIKTEIIGLGKDIVDCSNRLLGFHIHEGVSCNGNENDMFADTMGHYNPKGCKHPFHAGDMPPLFNVKGKAFMIFLTDRFSIDEVIGRTIIIHSSPDDFTTQPSGNSGEKIACGIIKSTK